MPLYEYECPDCGTFERVQKFSDPILTACPTCEGPVQKLLSAPAIQFKGTGWYVTDYARKTSPEAGPPKNDNGGSTASSSSSKDETASTPRTSTSKDSAATGSSSTK